MSRCLVKAQVVSLLENLLLTDKKKVISLTRSTDQQESWDKDEDPLSSMVLSFHSAYLPFLQVKVELPSLGYLRLFCYSL